MQPRTSIRWRLHLDARRGYAFLGSGDNDARVVTVVVEDLAGTPLAKSSAEGRQPAATFVPPSSGVYVVRLALQQAHRPSFCALAILQEGGDSLQVDQLEQVLQRIMAGATAASQHLRVRFHEEPNQWSLFGAILRPRDTTTLSGVHLERRSHIFIAAGDHNAKNLDLFLKNHAGDVVSKDDTPDATPVFLYTPRGHRHQLAVRSTDATASTLVIAVILDVM